MGDTQGVNTFEFFFWESKCQGIIDSMDTGDEKPCKNFWQAHDGNESLLAMNTVNKQISMAKANISSPHQKNEEKQGRAAALEEHLITERLLQKHQRR